MFFLKKTIGFNGCIGSGFVHNLHFFGGINQLTEWTYDQLGRQVSIAGWTDNTDDNTKQTTIYDYNRRGNVTKITYPDTKTIQYGYNPAGTVKHRIDQRNFVTYYEYDGLGSLTLKSTDSTIINDPNRIYGDTPPQLTVETFTYDGAGRMLTAVKTVDDDDVSDTTFAYNDLGKLTDTWDKHFGAATAKHVGYSYDQAGLLTSTTYPDGTIINRTNTWDGQIDTLSRSGSQLVDYSYIGPRTARRAYNTTTTVNTDYSYDNLGRVTDITAGSLVDFHYDYVANENNIWKKRFDHRTNDPYNDYDYDDIDRLTDVEYLSNSNDTESFVMDDLGNRDGNQTLRGDGTVNFTVDTATNRYTSITGNTITHDNAGNLTTDKDGYQHEYDCENRIIKITDVNDVEIATFDYDALNRRIRKVDSKATETTLYYYSDNWQVLAEYDDANSLQSYFVYGNYIDEPLVMNNGSDYYYLHDHLYSSVALLNGSGTVAERYKYDAYGKMTRLDPDFTAWSGTIAGNPYYFTGRRLDTLDGGKKQTQYSRNRYYDAPTGRFLQHDPLGLNPAGLENNKFDVKKQHTDGVNMYEYARSNSQINIDPKGTYIYLVSGNNTSNPVKRKLHQKVCVDVWNTVGDPIAYDKRCYSFGLIGLRAPCPGKYWLGWKSVVLPSPLAGEIYIDTFDSGDKIVKTKKTAVWQDKSWKNYMDSSRVGLKDVYSARHNCRTYSQMEFDSAP